MAERPAKSAKSGGRRGEVFLVLHDFVCLLAAITVIFVFVVRLVGVSGPSMTPTLQNGEFVLLLSNFLSDRYEDGDVVVAAVPSFDKGQPIVKRVIATAGQTVDIDFNTGEVRVDGVLLDEPYLKNPAFGECDLALPYQVPDGRYFVMGDHRSVSVDSRSSAIGCVAEEQIIGKVAFRFWPLSKMGFLK